MTQITDKFYFTGKPCKNGHVSKRYIANRQCAECLALQSVEWKRANKDKVNAQVKKRYARDAAAQRARALKWHYDNRAKSVARSLAYRAAHLEESRAKAREWVNTHKPQVAAAAAARHAAKLQRTPKWSDLEAIKKIYEECPKGHHVDHIIPLRGALVSGLHVPNNLQYLPAAENIRKHNYFDLNTFEI